MAPSSSRLVPPLYPPAGTSEVADKIRQRRGARGLTPLDGTLLHYPSFAGGWNSLLGAVRTGGKIPGDVRELMILRVAAINGAAFEWIHHEHVGRDHGLTTEQLYLIRDTNFVSSQDDEASQLSPIQSAALAFAHHSTASVKVPPQVTSALRIALKSVKSSEETLSLDSLVVEAASIVSTYNMVSRFLVSLDVAAMSDSIVPWAYDRSQHQVVLPDGHKANVVTYTTDRSAPWIVCCNSLLTNVGMWEWALPAFLGPQGRGEWLGRYKTYNVLLHDQRGHGSSSPTSSQQCTIPLLATDVSHILSSLNIPTPVHSVIGVSQGGATALSFGANYPQLTKSIVACDTSAKTPAGNKEAWNQRIELASKGGVTGEGIGTNMRELGEVTTARWFPLGSPCSPEQELGEDKVTVAHRVSRTTEILEHQTLKTTLDGFKVGASALMEYDLLEGPHSLLGSTTPTLLIAGSLDGNGKIAQGMSNLQKTWAEKGGKVVFKAIEGAGHLPMVDRTEEWWEAVQEFLERVE